MEINDIKKFEKDKKWHSSTGAPFVDELSEKITGRIARSRHFDVTYILYIIKELMGEKCKTVVDIGALWGGSTITMMQSEHPSTFITIDLFDGYYVICNGCLVQTEGGCHNRRGSTCRGITLEDKYKNIYQVKHWEKSGVFNSHIDSERNNLLKTDEYYIDDEFKKITSYGGSTVDNLAIPLAVYLGFKKIYLLGCDGGWNHFYDGVQKPGKRDWINYKHVIKKLDSYGVSLLNCDKTNFFKELKYEKYEDILNEI